MLALLQSKARGAAVDLRAALAIRGAGLVFVAVFDLVFYVVVDEVGVE